MLLVCELFRVHEMRSQLEVTEMFEPSFQKNLAAQKYMHGNGGLISNCRPT